MKTGEIFIPIGTALKKGGKRHSRPLYVNEIDCADRNFSSFQLRADEENRRSLAADHQKNH